MNQSNSRRNELLLVFVDASVQPSGVGLGVAYKDRDGKLIGWRGKSVRSMTSIEAEYEALIYALEQVRRYGPTALRVFSDNLVVMAQMAGAMRVNHDSLKQLFQRAKGLERRFASVTYMHIPRELNVLADAMAEEAVLRPQMDQWLTNATSNSNSGNPTALKTSTGAKTRTDLSS